MIGPEQPFCIIGERINPTGRKAFQAQLQAGDLSQVEIDVAEQVAGGADVLDVNVGDPMADEVGPDGPGVPLVQGLTDLPLCIDSSIIEALEAGLSAYEGKALVNSVTGEDERLEAILPIVARHGAAVIGLANDDEIRMEPEERLAIAKKIVSAAGDHGIPPEDVIIDPLAMPIGAEPRAVTAFVETLQLLRDELGVNTTCGASNTSFAMPGRHALGATFLVDRAEPRADERDHGRALAAVRRRGARDRPPARARRVGRAPGSSATATRRRRRRRRERRRADPGGALGAARARPAALRAGRRRHEGDARAGGDDALRRGELERGRDRLDLRRPRHLQEVQGARRVRLGRDLGGRPARVRARRAEGRLAARVPRRGERGRRRRGAAAADAPEGGARRRRAARDPAPGRAEALPRADRADARGPDLRPRARARGDGRPRAARPARARARRSGGRCATRTGRSPRCSATTC